MIKIGDYEKIMSDHNIFNQVVYTPMSEALKLLEERRKDAGLIAKVEKLLEGNIPDFLKNKKCAVLSRHIATPNHESRMFIKIAQEYNLHPVFFEYHEDKFTPNINKYKHSLGQLHIPQKTTKNCKENIERITIVDFNKHSGQKLKDIKTIWNESLISFHKKLFVTYDIKYEDFETYDGSDWYNINGGEAEDFYTNFFLLFVCFGISFENFLTSKDGEGEFTKKIVLPAIERVIQLTGVKPLITPIGPLEIETEGLWYHHLSKIKKIIPN